MRIYRFLAPVAAAALVAAAIGWRSVQSAVPASPAQISVTADGLVHARPDTARIWLGVETFGPTLTPVDREADQRMVSVVAALRSAGIADQHIRTSGLAIAPQYQTQDSQLQHMTGYVVRSTLEVETDDIQGVPALLDTAMAAGANRVDRIVFESSVLDDLRAQARDQAWQSARVQADQLAQRAGTRLDHLTSADEPVLEDTTQIQPDRATGYAASQAGSSTSTVQQGEIEVRVRVHLVWATQ